MLIRLGALALLLALAPAPALAARTYTGYGVLITGQAPIRAYLRTSQAPHGATRLEMWETANGRTVTAYDVNMTKLLHTIVVSDDLRAFAHIHPALHAGRFAIDIPPQRGPYHVYIDGDPHALGRQVFRFDVPALPRHSARIAHAAGTTVRVGPYTVTLDGTTVAPQSIATLRITIRKNGRPATDLHPYLGAMAHGVFIGLDDLAYMHGHGMDPQMLAMAANDCGDAMMAASPPMSPNAAVPSTFALQLLAPRAQRYDFWLQFVGGTTLYTVPFLITAR